MANYKNDRQFTDYIHKNIATPIIYKKLKWEQAPLDKQFAEKIDNFKGVDYVFNFNGELITVQERFREIKYQNYSDFTIRYRRDKNKNENRKESEFYKIKADYFVYGIVNCYKNDVKNCTDFIKYAILDLKMMYKKIEAGKIIITDNNKNFCKIIDNKIIECPIKYNTDNSSSFFPVDISFLIKLWENEIVIHQKGFL